MKKLYSLFAAVVMTVAVNAQTQIFKETFGTPDGNQLVNNYVGYDNLAPIVFSGSEDTDIRSSSASTTTNYIGASGGGNVMINKNTKWLQIDGINTSLYQNVKLSFGQKKGSNNANNELKVQVSADGENWSDISYNRATGSGTAIWILISPSESLPSVENLRIKFSGTNSTEWRIDDIILMGDAIQQNNPVLNVDNAAIDFPQTLIGSTSEAQTLTVTGENLDAVPTYELSGADASEFSVSGSLTAEGGALSLTFHPATSGTKTATLTVTSGSLSQMVTLSGEGKALPVLTVDTDSMVFPETVVGETSDEEILEVNWANLSDLPAFEITGEDADAFEVANAVLKEDETGGYIHIVFKPSSTGIKTAVLTLTADGITKTVALSGTGVEDSSLSVGDTHTVKTGLVKNTLVDNVLVFTAKSEVNIYNFSGQTVKTASVSENTAVDVTGLPKGVYIVTGVVNGKNISQRIIKK